MANVDLTIPHWENVAATRQAVLAIASEWKGTPYLWGGNSKDGIDCSHFVYQVLNLAREKVAKPPYPAPQIIHYRSTGTIESSWLFFPVNVLEPCDLVLWDSHVGIIVNPTEGKFIGAQSKGVAEESYTSGHWSEQSGKRFLRFVHFF
jgi:N-acetylmuramoyl-L-alanine amidase